MSFQDNFLQDYTLTLPLNLKFSDDVILPFFQNYTKTVAKAWKIYSSFLLAVRLVLNHPNYLPGATGTDEILYNNKIKANVSTSPFSAVYLSKLCRFIYDNVAIHSLMSQIELNSTTNLSMITNLTLIGDEKKTVYQFLVSNDPSANDSFTFTSLDKVLIYTRTQGNILYQITDQEKTFMLFILGTLNYFYNVISKCPDDTILLNHSTFIELDQIIRILKTTYNIKDESELSNFTLVYNNIVEIGYFTLPYMSKINETFTSAGIPNYFIGPSIFELLMQEKKQSLIVIANYTFSSSLLIENNTSNSEIVLCETSTPLFTTYYLQK